MWFCIYLVGVVLAGWLLYRSHVRWIKRNPQEANKNFEFGYGTVAALLSWFTVFAMIMGALASFNELELENTDTPSQEELDRYMSRREERMNSTYDMNNDEPVGRC